MPYDENYLKREERARLDRLNALSREEREYLKREEELAARRRRDEQTNYEASLINPLNVMSPLSPFNPLIASGEISHCPTDGAAITTPDFSPSTSPDTSCSDSSSYSSSDSSGGCDTSSSDTSCF